jgi:membrane protein implicated in regulation of membrane protease activity
LLRQTSKSQKAGQAAFFSIARFGPGMIIVLSILIVLLVLLVYIKLYYLAFLPAIIAVLLLTAKYFELIEAPNPTDQRLTGKTCLVVKRVTRNERGIVKVYSDSGKLESELWSAELAADKDEIKEDQIARIAGMRSIILLIEPIEK